VYGQHIDDERLPPIRPGHPAALPLDPGPGRDGLREALLAWPPTPLPAPGSSPPDAAAPAGLEVLRTDYHAERPPAGGISACRGYDARSD
jgi:hypothetical protein